MPNAPDGVVRRRVNKVAHAAVANQPPRSPLCHVVDVQVAPVLVIGGVEDAPAFGVVRQRGHVVAGSALDILQVVDLAAVQVNGRQVGHLADVPHRGVKDVARRVVIGARDAAERRRRNRLEPGERILPDFFQVGLLPRALRFDPAVPLRREGHSVDVLELAGEIRLAALRPAEPLDVFVGPVLQNQVRHEPGPVEIRIGPHLEIGRGAFRLEPDDAVDVDLVPRHRAEHHFVVSAERAAHSPAEPGFHECREPFMKPAGRVMPRVRNRAVRKRDRVVRGGTNFAAE